MFTVEEIERMSYASAGGNVKRCLVIIVKREYQSTCKELTNQFLHAGGDLIITIILKVL